MIHVYLFLSAASFRCNISENEIREGASSPTSPALVCAWKNVLEYEWLKKLHNLKRKII